MATTATCVVCLEQRPLSQLRRLNCGHPYCRSDLRHLIEVALRERSRWPPRCCTNNGDNGIRDTGNGGGLTEDDVSWAGLPPAAYHRYLELRWKCNAPACPGCGKTVHPGRQCGVRATAATGAVKAPPPAGKKGAREGTGTGTGPRTGTGSRTTTGPKTGTAANDRQFEDLVRVQKWKKCRKCGRVIEKIDDGCDHIRCPCGNEFCYLCGGAWPACECPAFSERDHRPRVRASLNNTNTERYVRERAAPALPPRPQNRAPEPPQLVPVMLLGGNWVQPLQPKPQPQPQPKPGMPASRFSGHGHRTEFETELRNQWQSFQQPPPPPEQRSGHHPYYYQEQYKRQMAAPDNLERFMSHKLHISHANGATPANIQLGKQQEQAQQEKHAQQQKYAQQKKHAQQQMEAQLQEHAQQQREQQKRLYFHQQNQIGPKSADSRFPGSGSNRKHRTVRFNLPEDHPH